MNKLHWNSVRAQGSLPEDILRDMLMESYRLVAASLPKRTRAELGMETAAHGAQKREIP